MSLSTIENISTAETLKLESVILPKEIAASLNEIILELQTIYPENKIKVFSYLNGAAHKHSQKITFNKDTVEFEECDDERLININLPDSTDEVKLNKLADMRFKILNNEEISALSTDPQSLKEYNYFLKRQDRLYYKHLVFDKTSGSLEVLKQKLRENNQNDYQVIADLEAILLEINVTIRENENYEGLSSKIINLTRELYYMRSDQAKYDFWYKENPR
jgi:hypothetical protein